MAHDYWPAIGGHKMASDLHNKLDNAALHELAFSRPGSYEHPEFVPDSMCHGPKRARVPHGRRKRYPVRPNGQWHQLAEK